MKPTVKSHLDKYAKSKANRENWIPVFEECYEYALPNRESFYHEEPGQRRDELIFDETAVVGVQEFASRLQAGVVPNYSRWADLAAGSEIPPEEADAINEQLESVTDYVFDVIQNSNFAQEVHESFMDLAVGTGILAVEEGDSINPIVCSALPLPQVVLARGPDGKIDYVFRERKKIAFNQLGILYNEEKFPSKIRPKLTSNEETTVLEVVCRDYSRRNEEVWLHHAIEMTTECLLHSKQLVGVGSNPFICFRWGKCAGEVYGRGPLLNVLAAVKTTNKVIRSILENADMAISGMYQMEDDGVINPETINLVPGTIIPKAMGSRGLEPIRAAGDFNMAQLVLQDQRLNIKRGLFNDMLSDPNKTPATATEVAERMADLSRRMGSAFGRLQVELVQPFIQRVIYILKKQGRIELPTVNGREIKIRSVSPLAQAQANQDIGSVARFLEMVGGTFGPETLNVLIDSEETSVWLAKQFGVPESLIRDPAQRQQIAQAAMEAMQAQAQQQQGPQLAPEPEALPPQAA